MKAQHPIAHRMVETSSSELTFCRFGELLEETIHGRAGRAGGRELPRVLLLLEAAMFHHCNWGSSGGACSECYTPADPLHGLKKAAKTTQKALPDSKTHRRPATRHATCLIRLGMSI